MNNSEYIRLSLELHLFFDRIMKEHSFFLETSFTEKNSNLKSIAQDFQRVFSDILNRAVLLANNNLSNEYLMSGEFVTKNTLEAEIKTSNASGNFIDTDITKMELSLKSGGLEFGNQMLREIGELNRRTLPVIKNLISFKNEILNDVLGCKMYTTNYPLLIEHIRNEAMMYHKLLSKVERRELFNSNELYEQELFWNKIMKEHAQFIRGLLDPSEEELIMTANKYAEEYEQILDSSNKNMQYITNISLNETMEFRNFKIAGEEGILNCKIKSIIVPLLADHVVREANHFIRILRSVKI